MMIHSTKTNSWQKLKNIQTISDLLLAIPDRFFGNLASWLLMYWIFSPLMMMLFNAAFDRADEITPHIVMLPMNSSFWYMMLQQSGYLGCFIALIYLLRKMVQQHFPSSGQQAGRVRLKLTIWQSIKHSFNHRLYIYFLFGALLWSGISTLFSMNQSLSFSGTSYRQEGFVTMICYAGIFSCGFLLAKSKNWQKVFRYFVHTATLQATLTSANVPLLHHLLRIDRMQGVFYNQNHYGYYLCLALLCAVLLPLVNDNANVHSARNNTLFDRTSSGKSKLLLMQKMILFLVQYYSVVILSYALVANQSFGPYLGVIGGFVSLVLLIAWRHKQKIFYVMSCFFILFLISYLFSTSLQTQIVQASSDIKQILTAPAHAEQAGSGRWVLWQHGVRFIWQQPLFGHGLETLGILFREAGLEQDRIHNTFLQLAATIGIPGVLFYVMSLVTMMTRFFRFKTNQSALLCGLFALVLTYVISSFFGNSMFYTSPFYLMFLGFAQGMLDEDQNKKLQQETILSH